jgi:ribonucleoside-diphosphate reductase alpha chain
VRVSDEFMRAVESGAEFGLRGRKTGEVIETVDAKSLFRKMAQAAWECADPGIQYDDTINDWHTNPETGRITASNPCFPADQRVVTDKGLIRIGDLVSRAALGETFDIYTNDVTSEDEVVDRVVATRPVRYMVTGTNEIVELRFSDGSRLRCTPKHRVWTTSGWVRAEDLTQAHAVVRSFHRAARLATNESLPEAAVALARHARTNVLPEKWSETLAHYLGWGLGDGSLTNTTATTIYGGADEQLELLPRHQKMLAEWMGFAPKPSLQANGTVQLRSARRDVVAFLQALGVTTAKAAGKVVPDSIFEAPEDFLVAFLQGLFDADGCVIDDHKKGTRYVGLHSSSEELVIGVQELLASMGIASRIYEQAPKGENFEYTRRDGSHVVYRSDDVSYDLRITGRSMREFAASVGFTLARKTEALLHAIDQHRYYDVDETVVLRSRQSVGFETTYNLTEPRNHSYIVSCRGGEL